MLIGFFVDCRSVCLRCGSSTTSCYLPSWSAMNLVFWIFSIVSNSFVHSFLPSSLSRDCYFFLESSNVLWTSESPLRLLRRCGSSAVVVDPYFFWSLVIFSWHCLLISCLLLYSSATGGLSRDFRGLFYASKICVSSFTDTIVLRYSEFLAGGDPGSL